MGEPKQTSGSGENADTLAQLAVVGCLVKNQDAAAKIFEIVLPEMFGIAELGEIFRVAQDIHETGRPVTGEALRALLPKDVYSNTLVASEFSDANPDYAEAYAEIVRENWRKRTTAAQLAELGVRLREPGAMMNQCLAEIERLADAQREIENKINSVTAKELKACIVDWMRRMSQPPNTINTGYGELDRLTGGLERGGLYVISARPGHGKTDFALNLALRMSRSLRVTYHTLELTRDQCVSRLVANVAGVNGYRIRDRKLSDSEMEATASATKFICNNTLVLDERAATSTADIKSSILKTKPDLLIIDHLLQMAKNFKFGQKDHDAISVITKTLKELAKKYNIVILLLAQTLRSADSKLSKPESLYYSDIQGGGAIEQDADGVCFLVPDKTANEKPSGDECWVAAMPWCKNRFGGTGMLRFNYYPHYSKFLSQAGEREEQPTDKFVVIEDDGDMPF